jgi:hypothetical protein
LLLLFYCKSKPAKTNADPFGQAGVHLIQN